MLEKHTPEGRQESKEEQNNLLTEENLKEIQLFSVMDYQPFFRHYVQETLRLNQDLTKELNTQGIQLPLQFVALLLTKSYLDFFKNDKPMIHQKSQLKYQMRQNEKKADAESKYLGYGTRKASKAVCMLKAGSGKIVVNNREFTEYFSRHPQRFKIVLPLVATQLTCAFDVSIRVYGGGTQGQSEAAALAVAKVPGFNAGHLQIRYFACPDALSAEPTERRPETSREEEDWAVQGSKEIPLQEKINGFSHQLINIKMQILNLVK